MEKQKVVFQPPCYLSEDTSNEQARRIPYLNLGMPKLYEKKVLIYSCVIKSRDISGNYCKFKR